MGGARVPRGLAIGGSDLAAESRMRGGHVRVHVHITVRALGRGAGAGLGLRWPRGPMAMATCTCAPRAAPRAWLSDGAALPVGPHFEGPGANPPFRGRDYN